MNFIEKLKTLFRKKKQDSIEDRWWNGCDICGCKEPPRPNTIHSFVPANPSDVCMIICNHHTDEEVDAKLLEICENRKAAMEKTED